MYRSLLPLLLFAACSAPLDEMTADRCPGGSPPCTTPSTPPPPAPSASPTTSPLATPVASQPAAAPLVLSWGANGHLVASGAEVTIHSRIRLKDQPDTPEPILEGCLPKAACLPVELQYEIENTGASPVRIWHSWFWFNHKVVLLTPSGGEAPLTAEGKKLRDAFDPRGSRNGNIPLDIEPGKITESEGPVDLYSLSRIFSYPSKPGRYSVRVDYEEDIAFSSNTLTLWIVQAGARALLGKLNGWDPKESDVYERPWAHPGEVASGETGGFITSQKEALAKLGVEVAWDALAQTYRITSAR